MEFMMSIIIINILLPSTLYVEYKNKKKTKKQNKNKTKQKTKPKQKPKQKTKKTKKTTKILIGNFKMKQVIKANVN